MMDKLSLPESTGILKVEAMKDDQESEIPPASIEVVIPSPDVPGAEDKESKMSEETDEETTIIDPDDKNEKLCEDEHESEDGFDQTEKIKRMRLALAMFHAICDKKQVLEVGKAVMNWTGSEYKRGLVWEEITQMCCASSGFDTSSNVLNNMMVSSFAKGPEAKRVPGFPEHKGEDGLMKEVASDDDCEKDWCYATLKVLWGKGDDELNEAFGCKPDDASCHT
jgi:hypothetical protein